MVLVFNSSCKYRLSLKQAGKKPEIAREPGQIIFKIVREILKTVREHLSAGPKGRFSLRPEARIFLIFEPL